MKKNTCLLGLFLLAAAALPLSAAAAQVRKPSWAGQFYDRDPARLSAQIDEFLKSGARPATGGAPIVLIAPHAGYPYSGRVAGKAYATVAGADYETVIIIAPSHRVAFDGCSVDELSGFETPLGTAVIDQDVVRVLKKEAGFDYVPEAHASEHAVEVQIPFIQRALPGAKIVPVIMGSQDQRTIRDLAEALAKIAKSKKILVVASTDMSHFLTKKEANVLDASTIALVKTLSTEALLRKVERHENIMCGGGPVISALMYAKKSGPVQVEVLQYADSSEAGTPETSVVGYFAAAVLSKSGGEVSFALTREEKNELVRIARQAIQLGVESNTLLVYQPNTSNFRIPKGVFVTITKKGELRGCIGFIEPVLPLCQAVIQAAYYAALQDTRFGPVAGSELKDLEVEVSVLSPLTRIADPRLVKVGKHGLVIEQGGRKGLLLPQVPVQFGWTHDEFLEQACLKAGLPSDAWKKGAAVYTFEALVFH